MTARSAANPSVEYVEVLLADSKAANDCPTTLAERRNKVQATGAHPKRIFPRAVEQNLEPNPHWTTQPSHAEMGMIIMKPLASRKMFNVSGCRLRACMCRRHPTRLQSKTNVCFCIDSLIIICYFWGVFSACIIAAIVQQPLNQRRTCKQDGRPRLC